MRTELADVLRFGVFEVDLRAGEVRKQGVRVKLQEQPFQVLNILLQRPGDVVTREELRSRLWQSDTFVDFDNGLNTSINKLREALGDSADSPRFIETLPRRGYRFIAPVNGNDVQKPVVSPQPWKFAVRVGIAATAVAVVGGGLLWITRRHPSSLPELKLRQLTTNSMENPVRNGMISSDGKYLAYADPKKICIKLIETGEMRIVPQPEALKTEKTAWEIVSWFPDSIRFLVNAHAAGLGGEELNSQNVSIWMVSVLGEPPHKLRDGGYSYSVSPDGSLIAFGMNKGRFGGREIWLMESNGEHPRKLIESGGESAIDAFLWSPDGQRVSYIRHNEDLSEFKIISRAWKDGLLADMNEGPPADVTPSLDMKNAYDGLELPGGRVILSVGEPGTVNETCNFWIMRVDPRTGNPIEKPRQLTHWGGFCMSGISVTKDGKHLSFLRWQTHTSIYMANLEGSDSRIGSPSHFTLTESLDLPVGWTADSKAILFMSSRSGHWGIYKQFLNEDTAEPLLTGLDEVRTTRVSADGQWFLYGVPAKPGDQSSVRNVMRVPITGGPPQLVFTARPHSQILCARSPSTLCLIGEPTEDRKQIILTTFDAVNGRGAELTRFDLNPNDDRWALDLSTDGTRIAATRSPEGPIYILSLRGHPLQEIKVKGRKGMLSFDWTTSGKGLYVSSEAPGGAELLYVDFQGNSQVLWKNRAGNVTAGLPSPDGRHLAIMGLGFDGNIWMMENF
jgi:DNA-binding winged helix-turn-helix (wHTH) protein/Tol biopolymer transport system component